MEEADDCLGQLTGPCKRLVHIFSSEMESGCFNVAYVKKIYFKYICSTNEKGCEDMWIIADERWRYSLISIWI